MTSFRFRVSTASNNPAAGLWSPPFKDKLRVVRTLVLAQVPARQTIKPYQQLRYWSTVPFRHGPIDVVKAFGNTVRGQSGASSAKSNPNLKGELIRHLNEDSKMSGFDFGLQFLDADRMTYWGKCRDANFWIENASLESNKRKHLSTRSHALPFYRSRNFRWMVGRQAVDVRAGTDDRRPVSPDVQGVPAESEVGQLQRGSGAGSAHEPRRQVTHGRSEL